MANMASAYMKNNANSLPGGGGADLETMVRMASLLSSEDRFFLDILLKEFLKIKTLRRYLVFFYGLRSRF